MRVLKFGLTSKSWTNLRSVFDIMSSVFHRAYSI